jgi:hypothetical protein
MRPADDMRFFVMSLVAFLREEPPTAVTALEEQRAVERKRNSALPVTVVVLNFSHLFSRARYLTRK